MASTTELENLIVRLTGDGEQYAKMLKQAMEQTQATAHHLQEATHKIEGFGEVIEQFASKTVSALKATAEFEFLKGTFEAFSGREQTFIRLSAALETNGRAVAATTKEYKEFAREVAHTSLTTSEGVIKLLAKAEAYELTGEAAEKAVKSALAIAAVNDTEADSVIRVTAAIAKGNIEQAMTMARLIPQLRGVKDEEEFLAKAQRLVATGLKTMDEQSRSSEGAVHHLSAAWRGFQKDLGESVAMGVKPVLQGLTYLVNLLKELPSYVKTAIVVAIALSATLTTLGLLLPVVTAGFAHAALAAKGFTVSLATNPILLWTAVIAAAGAAGYALGSYLRGTMSDVKALNAEMERGAKLQSQVKSNFSKGTDESVVKAHTIGDVQTRRIFLTGEIGAAQKEVEGYKEGVKEAEEEVKRLDTVWNRFTNAALINVAKTNLKDTNEMLDAARGRVQTLKEEYEKVSLKQGLKDADALVKKLEDQANAVGKTAEEVERARLKEMGLSDQQLKNIDAHIIKLRDLQRIQNTKEAVNKTTDAIFEQIATFNMSEQEIERWRLQNQYASESQLALYDALSETLEVMQEQQEYLDRGEEETRKYLTPMDKFIGRQSTLNELLRHGAIDVGTYERGMRDARKELEGAAAAQKDFVGAGSAEALSRLQQYKEANFSKPDINGRTFAPASGNPNSASVGSADAVNRLDKTNTLLKDIKDAVKLTNKPNMTLAPAYLEF